MADLFPQRLLDDRNVAGHGFEKSPKERALRCLNGRARLGALTLT
jgi:hypothetical protein